MRIRARAPRSNAELAELAATDWLCVLCVLCVLSSQRRAAAARACSGSTSTKKRCTSRSTARRRSTSTARLPALNALRGTSFDPSPTARDRSRRGPRVLLHARSTRVTRVQSVAPQRPPLRPRAARRRRRPPARARRRRSPGRRTSSSATAICSSTSRPSARRPAGSPGTVGWNGSELVAFRLHLPSKIGLPQHHRTTAAATSWSGSSR